MNNLFVKKGDSVKLIAGKNKGRTGKVLAVDVESGRVVVDGWNIIVKHVKAKSAQKAGGIQKMAGSIDASNVQIVCPSCSAATRVSIGSDSEGKKVRLCKKCGASLDSKQKIEKKAKKSKKDEMADEKPAKKEAKAKKEKTEVKAETKTEVKEETATEKPAKKAKREAEKTADKE